MITELTNLPIYSRMQFLKSRSLYHVRIAINFYEISEYDNMIIVNMIIKYN